MFYHIIIELKEKDKKDNNKELSVLDIEEREELISDYIFPYFNNEEVNFDGHMSNFYYKYSDFYEMR